MLTQRALRVCPAQVPAGNVLLLLAHNGPEGLGSEPYSICGVDWKPEAGDWGDPDLAAVLQQLREQGMRVDLVLHGHMHHMIKGVTLRILIGGGGGHASGRRPTPSVAAASMTVKCYVSLRHLLTIVVQLLSPLLPSTASNCACPE
jgi:hypothetical protein